MTFDVVRVDGEETERHFRSAFIRQVCIFHTASVDRVLWPLRVQAATKHQFCALHKI